MDSFHGTKDSLIDSIKKYQHLESGTVHSMVDVRMFYRFDRYVARDTDMYR